MKAMYSKPEIEITKVGIFPILKSVSGMDLNDQGEDDGSHGAQAPGRRPF